MHNALLLQALDEGHKELALEAVLVELVRAAVGGGNEEKAAVEETSKEAVQDHGVRNVVDEELVQAEHARVRREAVRNALQRVLRSPTGRRQTQH